ncbi:DUF421 domain-containing protein [Nakamurella lactea]|uniref:DUF421 domain-containing protein n=1 Tax=Nakamurella lactea TaxID=459515 RepID=UPI0003FC1A70|nr:YetF domain-containing protein [Nakamurella lactea]
MWHSMFSFDIPVAEKIIRTIAIYLLIVIIFRITGRRSLSQSNTQDLVVIFLLSNVVQNAVIGPDNTVLGGAVGAVVLVSANSLLDNLSYRFPAVQRWLDGTSVEVVADGVATPAAKRLQLRPSDLDHVVRLQNGNDLSEVRTGELDPDGHLVITLKEQFRSATAGDIQALNARLDRIEALLTAR